MARIHSSLILAVLAFLNPPAPAQQFDQPAVIRGIDAAVMARVNNITSYSVTEHYTVYHGTDQTHPTAQMTVKTTYSRSTGKSYAILSESGSALVRHFGLETLLDNEKKINLPGNVEHSWITSANYEMTLKPGGIQRLDGRDCIVLSIYPHQKAPNLIVGALWVDPHDYSIVRLEGVASQVPSIFAGTTHMMRQYANINGFAMATHARAESSTFLYGTTVVAIDYSGYTIQTKSTK